MVATEPHKPQLLEVALETGQLLAAVMTPVTFLSFWINCLGMCALDITPPGLPQHAFQSLLLRAHRKQNARNLHLVHFPSINDKKKSIPTFGIYSSWNLFRLHLTESGAAQPWKAGRATFIYKTTMHGNFQFLRIPKAFLQRSFYLHWAFADILGQEAAQLGQNPHTCCQHKLMCLKCVNKSNNVTKSDQQMHLDFLVIWMTLPPWG